MDENKLKVVGNNFFLPPPNSENFLLAKLTPKKTNIQMQSWGGNEASDVVINSVAAPSSTVNL